MYFKTYCALDQSRIVAVCNDANRWRRGRHSHKNLENLGCREVTNDCRRIEGLRNRNSAKTTLDSWNKPASGSNQKPNASGESRRCIVACKVLVPFSRHRLSTSNGRAAKFVVNQTQAAQTGSAPPGLLSHASCLQRRRPSPEVRIHRTTSLHAALLKTLRREALWR